MGNPDQARTRQEVYRVTPEAPRQFAQILNVNTGYNFVVLDAGVVDGVKPDSILSVLRDGRRIGKVMVTKARDKISAAVILPEWRTKVSVAVGDPVEL